MSSVTSTTVSSIPTRTRLREWWAEPGARRVVAAAGPALLALTLATVATVLGWSGVDQAAQAYRVEQVRLHGLVLWDSGWYGGNYPLSYSAIFPLIAALITLQVAAVAAATAATYCFDRLVTGYLGRRPLGSWYFAISTVLQVAIGQLPFLAGEALGLGALLALTRNRRGLAVALAVLSALCSPLAAAFLAMACVVWALANRGRRRWLIVTAIGSVAVVGLISLVFPGEGPFPFPWTGLVIVELLCVLVLTPLVRTTRAVRVGAVAYGAACLLSFAIPNPLGGNAPRLAASIGIPLLACFLTAPSTVAHRLSAPQLFGRRVLVPPRWRTAAILLLVPFAVWQWAPGEKVTPGSEPAAQKAFYAPLLAELHAIDPGPTRVEIPPTEQHWEAAYVAPYLSLARGWERQLDIADNPIFYQQGALTPRSYTTWLILNGVSWVALPSTQLDYAAQAEGQLLQSGAVRNLQLVWVNSNWTLWRVANSPGLLTGPGRLTELGPDRVDVTATAAGLITLRIRYTHYWTVSSGRACVGPGVLGWTDIRANGPGPIQLAASVLGNGTTCPGP
jgi:hypothetical protein